MQIAIDIGLAVLIALAASFLLMAKLHEQLSGLIQGRLYQENSRKLPNGVHARYRASRKEWILHIVSICLMGTTIGFLTHLEQPLLPSLAVGALALATFSFLIIEVIRNFYLEEERNRALFKKHKRH